MTNRPVDELPGLLTGSPTNVGGPPISRWMDKVILLSAVSPEKAERPPPPPPSSNSASITTTDADQKHTNSVSPIRVPQAPDLVATETPVPAPEKPNADVFEWPRTYFSLSKEEKEDEFITLKNCPTKVSPESSKKKAKTNKHILHHQESIVTNGNSKNDKSGQTTTNNGSSKHHGVSEHSPGGGDVLLQWGQRKRSRASRSENGSAQARQMIKTQRGVAAGSEKPPSAQHSQATPAGNTRSGSLRPCTTLREATTRNLDVLPTLLNGTPSSNSSRPISRSMDKRTSASPDKAMKPPESCPPLPISANNVASAAECSSTCTTVPQEKVNMEFFEWPKIYISLSRKEKEEDFMAIKGTKLPQRPKRRPKIVDRNLQYCFPGMWLCDLSRGRYEVREKKCVKKKRRGLKGLESMDSDSE